MYVCEILYQLNIIYYSIYKLIFFIHNFKLQKVKIKKFDRWPIYFKSSKNFAKKD